MNPTDRSPARPASSASEAPPSTRRRTALRLVRVVLVSAPFLAFGIYLGTGRASRPPSNPLPDYRSEPPQVRLEHLPANESDPAESPPEDAPLRVHPRLGEGLRLSGGDLAEVEMRMTRLPPKDAFATFDRKWSKNGWKLDEKSTILLGEPEGNLGRVYVREGAYRILIVGAPIGESEPMRPVTVFEGRLAAH